MLFRDFGGERGIRTPGASQHAGFQDRCIRPLCQLSAAKLVNFFYCVQAKLEKGFIFP